MQRLAIALALVACHHASPDPADKTSAFCERVHNLFVWLPAPLETFHANMTPNITPAQQCEMARHEMTGVLHGFALGMQAPDLAASDQTVDALKELSDSLIHALGEGCNPLTEGSPEKAIASAKSAIAAAHAKITTCPD